MRVPEGFTVNPKLARQLERRLRRSRRGRHRLGPRRVARVRLAPARRHPDPPHGPGHRARHVLAPPPRAPRRPHGRARRSRCRTSRARRRRSRSTTRRSPSTLRRLRVRLLDRSAGGARALGGAVRRLRQRRADDRRPVHLERPRQVEADLAADAAAPARVRGQRARALERPARAVPAARRAGQHADRELHDVGPVLPPAPPPGARPGRAAARRS